jgi:3,4-dihydroxy 2-butanone 4-phosphate synthase/GTP cyclohydrolase II
MTDNPSNYIGLAGYGLEIVERIPLGVPATRSNRDNLKTKCEKLGQRPSR